MPVQPTTPAGLVVQLPRRRRPDLYVAGSMARAPLPMPRIAVPRERSPEAPGAVLAEVGYGPHDFIYSESVMMPDEHGISVPWRELSGSPLLLPSSRADDVFLRRSTAVALAVDHAELPVPADGECLRAAARQVLARTQSETILRVALHWAFALEVSHRGASRGAAPLAYHDLSSPELNRQPLLDNARMLADPQMVRLIAVDAVWSRGGSTGADERRCPLLSPVVRGLVAEFFPSVETHDAPSHSEVRTALWVLSCDSPLEDISEDGLSAWMAHTFAQRSIGSAEESLLLWSGLVSLPDDLSHGMWIAGETPSDLRRDLLTASGLDLREVARVVHAAVEFMVLTQDHGNQLWTLMYLEQIIKSVVGQSVREAVAFAAEHLLTSAAELSAADSTPDDDDGSPVVRRRRIEECLHRRPFVEFDDGSIVPVNLRDVVHRTVELCQEPHNGRAEPPEERRRRFGRILGHSFEAAVIGMCHSLGGVHRVLDRRAVETAADGRAGRDAKRADVVVCDSNGSYLVIEATKKNLLGGIRYGDRPALEKYIDEHLRKHGQALSTASHLHAIAVECGAPMPRHIATLVVGDLPLRHDAAVAALFDERSANANPPFLCGFTEFTMLIDFGQQGWSVPSVVNRWQATNDGRSLGLFLQNYPLS